MVAVEVIIATKSAACQGPKHLKAATVAARRVVAAFKSRHITFDMQINFNV